MKNNSQLQGERRWTAVLCADLIGFTTISEQLGPERTYELMRDIMGVAKTEIERFGGHIIEYAGDAIFAVFGAPTAAENASLDACRSALGIQARMRDTRDNYEKQFGVRPGFRIGIAGGSVVFGSLGHDDGMDINVLGDAVTLSMRLQKVADRDNVVCSAAIFDLVDGYVVTEFRGETALKGFTGKHSIYQINALLENITPFEGRMRRGSSAFLGRKDEIDTLKQWADAPIQFPMLEISGPPGAGKSRLIYEFLTHDTQQRNIIMGQCNLNTQSKPLTPIVEIIRQSIGWTEHMSTEDIKEALSDLLDGESKALDYLVWRVSGSENEPVFNSLSTDNGIAIRKLCERILQAVAEASPTIFVIEDVHWIDPVSEVILMSFVEMQASARARFITSRRAYMPTSWVDHKAVKAVELAPLKQDFVGKLIEDLANAPMVAEPLVGFVVEKSEGNPLFVEEIVRYLQFANCLERDGDVVDLVPGNYNNIVSGNLQHLVLSRFDALPEEDRSILVLAAARGRRFSVDFLSACAPEHNNIDDVMERALEAGLIEADSTGRSGEFRFSHALIGDAIYQSLLGARRRETHDVIGHSLEQTGGSVDELADQFTKADNQEKAVQYLWKAAEKAYEVFAVIQVDAHLDTAFTMIEQRPDLVSDEDFGEMVFLWGRTLDVYGNFSKQNDVMTKHRERLEKAGQMSTLSLCLSMRALALCHAAEFHQAQAQLDEALQIATELDEEVPILWAKVVQMRINVDSGFGTLAETAALYAEVKPAAEKLEDSHLIQLSTYVMLTAHRSQGALKRADEYVDWLVAFGEKNKNNRAVAMANWSRCIHHLICERIDDAIDAADRNLQLTVPPTADWRVATVSRTIARLMRGDEDASPEDLQPHIDVLSRSHDTTLGNGAQIQFWINIMARGRFREGWQGLLKTQADIETHSTPELRRFIELIRAEVLMSISGISQSSGERPKMGARDLLQAVMLRVGARKKIEGHLNRFLELAPVQNGYFVARIHRNFGLLETARGNKAKARSHFEESVRLYEAEDMFEAASKVRGHIEL